MLTLAGVAAASPKAGSAQLVRQEYTEAHMGVGVRIVLYAPDDVLARRAARAAYARIADLEYRMSDHRSDGELRRLTGEAVGKWTIVERHLFAVLQRAVEIARRSDGAFDPTVGPYVRLWRAAQTSGEPPSPEALESAAARVGWDKVRLDGTLRAVRLAVPGMVLDLGGIAKGYILDAARSAMEPLGVTSVLIEAGGDIVVGDAPPDRPGWRIEVPGADSAFAAAAASLSHAAISTSGDTEQFATIDGRRYSQVVDPHTGLELTNRVIATVIAPDGMTADALATALTVLGVEEGEKFAMEFSGIVVSVRRRGADF
jgi:thiamine biosynthesis lipoprotein